MRTIIIAIIATIIVLIVFIFSIIIFHVQIIILIASVNAIRNHPQKRISLISLSMGHLVLPHDSVFQGNPQFLGRQALQPLSIVLMPLLYLQQLRHWVKISPFESSNPL